MPAAMKTPGVYIVEKSAFPSSVVEVATAIPAFIGYTESADNSGKSLLNKPWRITSMAEYHVYFGFGPNPKFTIDKIESEDPVELAANASFLQTYEADGAEHTDGYALNRLGKSAGGNYHLYYSMLLFFQNGGGPCYIVSIGNYSDEVEADRLTGGIGQLVKEQEPTMVVMPDAVLLDQETCIAVQQSALQHCGEKMKNRVTILDVWEGYKGRKDPDGDCIDNFRNALGINFLDFGIAYYPWINTTIVQDNDLSYANIANPEALQGILRTELEIPEEAPDESDVAAVQRVETVNNLTAWADGSPGETLDEKNANATLQNKSLLAMSPLFNTILGEAKNQLNLLPPSAAMAGVYTMVDNDRGVWKAPANVSLSSVVSPAVEIDSEEQEDLNVTTQGKSINAIRSFIGEGVLVWGGRTLDGNSLDWRYVQVRRTMIMLEESIRMAAKAYVFENNEANTWVTIKSMVNNFLTGIWKRGGLAGSSPGDAFAVFVGLGETMTPEDILEGIMRVTVLVALIRPAEFIEITFQQQMQQS